MVQRIRLENLPLSNLPALAPQLTPAEVIKVDGDAVTVSLGIQQVEVRSAVLDYQPSVDDQLLILGNDLTGHYAIGVLSTSRPRPKLKIETSEKSNATIVSVESGDLEVVAPRGAVRIVSSAGVDATTLGPINLRSRSAINASILDRFNQTLKRMCLSRRSAELQHDQVDVTAGRLQVTAHDAALRADDVAANLGNLSLLGRRVSSEIGSLFTKIDNAFQRVAGLWQLSARRTRMVVEETSHHKAQRIYSKADDVKVKADKIHLG